MNRPPNSFTPNSLTRRSALALIPGGAAALVGLRARADETGAASAVPAVSDAFPRQDPSRVKDVVRLAHFDLDGVRALVEASPALAKAAVDWGFGDWESALGAASHMGRHDMAELLLAHGARPDQFTHAMMGHVDAVRAIVAARPGIQRELGPHGFTLMHHARAGGDAAADVVAYLEQLGDADPPGADVRLPRPMADYLGEYRYGDAPDEVFSIIESRGSLGLKRGDGFARNLNHLGDDEFHPMGARFVRVRFDVVEGDVVAARVLDPDVLVVGRRVGS